MDGDRIAIEGRYRDVLTDAQGRVLFDRGWRSNTIVADCRRLLAGFLHGTGTVVTPITALLIGEGDPAWDTGTPPNPSPTATIPSLPGHTALVRRTGNPAGTSLDFAYVDTAVAPPAPTIT